MGEPALQRRAPTLLVSRWALLPSAATVCLGRQSVPCHSSGGPKPAPQEKSYKRVRSCHQLGTMYHATCTGGEKEEADRVGGAAGASPIVPSVGTLRAHVGGWRWGDRRSERGPRMCSSPLVEQGAKGAAGCTPALTVGMPSPHVSLPYASPRRRREASPHRRRYRRSHDPRRQRWWYWGKVGDGDTPRRTHPLARGPTLAAGGLPAHARSLQNIAYRNGGLPQACTLPPRRQRRALRSLAARVNTLPRR